MTVGAIIGLSLLTIAVISIVGGICYQYKKARVPSVLSKLSRVTSVVVLNDASQYMMLKVMSLQSMKVSLISSMMMTRFFLMTRMV